MGLTFDSRMITGCCRPLSALCWFPPDSSHSLLVSDFILPCRTWDRSKLARYLPHYLVEKALSFFIPFHSQQDSLVWGLTADGQFSVKSGALLVQGLVNGDVTIVDYAWIWKLLPPPKIKNFLWKACNDGLPSKERLERSHISFFHRTVHFVISSLNLLIIYVSRALFRWIPLQLCTMTFLACFPCFVSSVGSAF